MCKDLSREKKIECILRRALIYCNDMDSQPNREEIVQKAIEEMQTLMGNKTCNCG